MIRQYFLMALSAALEIIPRSAHASRDSLQAQIRSLEVLIARRLGLIRVQLRDAKPPGYSKPPVCSYELAAMLKSLVISGAILLWMLRPNVLAAQETVDIQDLFEMSLEEMFNVEIVSVTKKLERASTTPGTVYVITAEEIDRYGFRFLQEALQYVPSVYIYDPHSWVWGGQRGLVSNFSQTLLLINGREVNNLIAQEGFISRQFGTHNIERIEVVASPGSVLYGANALAGVINVITKEADPDYNGIELSVEAGSYNTMALSLLAGQSLGDIRIKASLRQFNSDEEDYLDFVRDQENYSKGWVDNEFSRTSISQYKNPSEARSLNVQLDFNGLYAGMNSYYNLQSHGLEKLRWNYADGEDHRLFTLLYGGYQGAINSSMDLKVEYQFIRSSLWGRYHGGLWPVSRLQSTDNLDLYSFPPEVEATTGEILHGPDEIVEFYPSFADYLVDQGIIDPNNITASDIQRYGTHIYTNKNSRGSQRRRIDVEWTWNVDPATAVDIGYAFDSIDYVGLAVTDAGFGLGAVYDIPVDLSKRQSVYESLKHGTYAQYRKTLRDKQLWLNLGARYDYQNHYGGTFNPRIGLVWQPTGSTIVKLLYGEAFREPNVFELSSDPDLKPATLRSFEVNLSHAFGKSVRFNLAAYHNTVSNFLSSVGALIGTGVGSVERQIVKGAEFRLDYKKNDMIAFINGSFLFSPEQEFRSQNSVETVALLSIPKTRANVGVSYRLAAGFSGSLLYRYVGAYDALSGNRALSDPFRIDTANDLKATLQVIGFKVGNMTVDGFLTVNNLTDSKIYQANIRRSGPHVFLQDGRNVQMRWRIRH